MRKRYDLSAIGILVTIRWIILVLMMGFVYLQHTPIENKPLHMALFLIFALSNLVLVLAPQSFSKASWVHPATFLLDIGFVTLTTYLISGWKTDLLLVYFLVVFMTATQQTLKMSFVVAFVGSALYLTRRLGGLSEVAWADVQTLLTVPSFFIVSMFTGFLAQESRRAQSALNDERRRGLALAALNELGQKLMPKRNPADVLNLVCKSVDELLGVDASSIFLFDQSRETYTVKHATGAQAGQLIGLQIPMDKGIVGWVGQNRKPAVVDDVAKDNRFDLQVDKKTGFKIRSLIAVPMILNDSLIGVVEGVNHIKEKKFTKEEINLLQTLAQQAAFAVVHTRFQEEQKNSLAITKTALAKEKKAVDKYKIMRTIVQNVSRQLDLDQLLSITLKSVMTSMDSDSASIMLIKGGNKEMEVVAAEGIGANEMRGTKVGMGESVAGQVASNEASQILHNGIDTSRYVNFVPKNRKIFSALSSPLIDIGGESTDKSILGVINVNRINIRESFTSEDEEFISALSYQIAIAVQNARSFEAEKKTVAKLETLEMMRTEFISSVTHELRTPLVSLRGYSSLLLKSDSQMTEESKRSSYQIMYNNADRLEKMVDHILTLSQVESQKISLNKTAVNLEGLLGYCVRVVETQTKNHKVDLVIDEHLGSISCDRLRVEQVLLNLLSNAIKYSPQGGKIVVSAKAGDGQVVVSVADEGLGVPIDLREKVFERFERVREESRRGIEGSGIGLYLVKEIIGLHGGTVECRQNGSKGSIFSFVLPVTRTAAAFSVKATNSSEEQ